MPVMQPPTGPIEVSDPNNVPETFVNGPFNIVKVEGWCILLSRLHGQTQVIFSRGAIRLGFKQQ